MSAPESQDPIERFRAAHQRVLDDPQVAEPGAVVLATCSAEGRPSARVVLVRSVGPDGFRFYTNYESAKARQLDANPQAALCFYWGQLEEQVRVEGRVARLSAEESAAYFAQRHRGSQVGAWASQQSRPLGSRAELEAAVAEAEARFADGPVPCPPHWGGYVLIPELIEFWTGRPFRLHDRERYLREGEGWRFERLQP